GGDLPLRLGRQAFSGPFGKSVGFVKADMAEGLSRVQPAAAGQGKDRPFAAFPMPIERRLPALLANGRPAVRKPELGPLVPTALDEAEILAAADRARREAEWFEPDLVAGGGVVVAGTRGAP